MLPTYWPTDAPPILRQNNAETSDVWLAHSQVSDAAALWAIAVRAIHESERRDPDQVAIAPVVLLEVLVTTLDDSHAQLPGDLARVLPRRTAPVPERFRTPTAAILNVDGRDHLANTFVFDPLEAFYAVVDGHWIVGLRPRRDAARLSSASGPQERTSA